MKFKKILALILSLIVTSSGINQTATQVYAATPSVEFSECSEIPVLKSSASRLKRFFSKKYNKKYDIFTSQNGLSFRIKKDNDVILTGIKKMQKNITIPQQVEILETIYDVTSISNEVFKNNTVIESINLPNTITDIDEYTFCGCCNLELVRLPESIKTIGKAAFKGCSNLQLTHLPENTTIIGDSAFEGCSNLQLTHLPSGIKTQPEIEHLCGVPCPTESEMDDPEWWAAVQTSLERPIPGTSVAGIGNYVFKDCTNLQLTELPNGITKIGESAFEGCANLQLTEIPEGVTTIGPGAFALSNIERISIPASVTDLGKYSLYTDSLREITLLTKDSLPKSTIIIATGFRISTVINNGI